MTRDDLTRTLLFNGMTDYEIGTLLSQMNAYERSYKRDTVILHAGDHANVMGLVLTGSVTIENNDLWGNCTILSHVGSGGFFAETYALLPEEVLLVDVRTNEDTRILFMDIAKVVSVPSNRQADKLVRNLLRISAHKNLTLSGRSFHTAPKSARGRVLSYLNAVALQKGSPEFDIPFDRQQLADYLNLERTALSKELGRMRKDGIIECRKNHFRLLHPDDAIR